MRALDLGYIFRTQMRFLTLGSSDMREMIKNFFHVGGVSCYKPVKMYDLVFQVIDIVRVSPFLIEFQN